MRDPQPCRFSMAMASARSANAERIAKSGIILQPQSPREAARIQRRRRMRTPSLSHPIFLPVTTPGASRLLATAIWPGPRPNLRTRTSVVRTGPIHSRRGAMCSPTRARVKRRSQSTSRHSNMRRIGNSLRKRARRPQSRKFEQARPHLAGRNVSCCQRGKHPRT
jgi:hypothetical protein